MNRQGIHQGVKRTAGEAAGRVAWAYAAAPGLAAARLICLRSEPWHYLIKPHRRPSIMNYTGWAGQALAT